MAKKKGLVFIITLMGIHIMENGKMIESKAREPIFIIQHQKNIQANGKKE